MSDPTNNRPENTKPLVVSLCGTYLKREMQSLYRQISSLKDHDTMVFAERLENLDEFPLEDAEIIHMEKRERPRHRGNFLLRFWFKHVIKKWPPPINIGMEGRENEYYAPYNLVELIEEHAPAAVHVYYGHKAVKYHRMLKDSGVPWLVSFHGVDVVKFLDQPGYREGLTKVFRDAKVVLARSESLLDRLRGLGCPEEKLRLNRTPVPLDTIDFKLRTPPADGHWRLFQACRLIPKKGLFTTLKALPKVVERWPDLKFVLAGVGPDEERFRAAVAEAGLENNVELVGWVDQKKLRGELAKSHAFLHPSELTETEDQEGVPNAMVEAMAAGLPILATTHGGIPEAVDHDVDGYLVPEKDHEALAEAILKLLDSPETLQKFSQQAHDSVTAKFGFDTQIAALESCYAETAQSSEASLDRS